MANYNNKRNNGGYNNFDLNKYETVKSRKTRLRNDYPDSYVMPLTMSDLNYAANYILMGALIWKDKKTLKEIKPEVLSSAMELASKAHSQNAGIVLSTIAASLLADGAGYSLSIAGGNGADKNAWVENAEESAVGRALDNMGYHSGSASQEEIKKVQHIEEAQKQRVQLENQINNLYVQLSENGHNAQYLSQVISQTVKPFNHLTDLSIDELTKLNDTLYNIQNPSYQQQQQQTNQPQTQNNMQQVPAGSPAPPPPPAQQRGVS